MTVMCEKRYVWLYNIIIVYIIPHTGTIFEDCVYYCLHSVGSSSSPRRGGVPDVRGLMMSSAVTTVEASDWSVSMRMDTPTLQSKEPLVQAVLASCAANLQWARPDSTHSHPIVR